MRKLLAIAVAVSALGLGGQVYAQQGPTAAATAASGVDITTPLTVMKTADLRFGSIVRPTANGTLDIAPGGTVTPSGSMSVFVLNATIASPRGASSFDVSGDPLRDFITSVPATATLARTGGGGSMTVSAIRTSNGTFAETLSSTGTATIALGGTLNIANNQPIGAYSGSIVLTVQYQ